MALLDTRQLRTLFSEIIQGRTILHFSSFGLIYVKHLNNIDLAEVDDVYNFYYDKCIKEGIPNYESKVESLINNNIWDKKSEEKLKDYKKLLIQYQENKSNEYLKSKRQIWEAQIGPLEKDIKVLEGKKNLLIGDTAEGFANKKSNEAHILMSFFKDKDFLYPLFTKEEFEQIEEKEVNQMYNVFNDYLKTFHTDNIKRVSLSGFFQNMLSLASDSVMELYGKAVIYLSFYQIDLAMYGKYFKNIMTEMGDKIPREMRNDPDKILEFVELNKNYKRMFPDEKEVESQTIVGATKEDLKLLGMESSANTNLTKKMKEKGGKLDIYDLEKL